MNIEHVEFSYNNKNARMQRFTTKCEFKNALRQQNL